jgi:hypothetical protein
MADVNAERFRREILVVAGLQHPHIVPVLSAGEMAGRPYLVMPFVEGESLRTRIARGGPMRIVDAVGVLRDVARALAYAHERGIVHRDIKPRQRPHPLRLGCRRGLRRRKGPRRRAPHSRSCRAGHADRRGRVAWNTGLHGARTDRGRP